MDNRRRILVTGASGFIGSNLCPFLREKGYFIKAVTRSASSGSFGADEYVEVVDIDESTDWINALKDIDFVIHLAGRAHVMDGQEKDITSLYHRVNALGTKRLAEQSAKCGAKRFIFISSVKVNGEGGLRPYTEEDIPAPQDGYGISKLEAEQVLAGISAETGLEAVILRLPLVYGPGVKANFKSLIKLVASGLPLPFKGINNKRSFLYVGNLADAIMACIEHPKAAGETFLVSDGQDLSTPDLIKMITCAMKNRNVPFFYLHPVISKALCKIIGKSAEFEKLTGNLLVDSSKIRNILGWRPPFTPEEGIRETVKGKW